MKTSSTLFTAQLTETLSPGKCWLDGQMATMPSGLEYVSIGSSSNISTDDARVLRRLYVWASLLQTAQDTRRDMLVDPENSSIEEVSETLVSARIAELQYELVIHIFFHEVIRLFSGRIGFEALSQFALIAEGEEFSVVIIKQKK